MVTTGSSTVSLQMEMMARKPAEIFLTGLVVPEVTAPAVLVTVLGIPASKSILPTHRLMVVTVLDANTGRGGLVPVMAEVGERRSPGGARRRTLAAGCGASSVPTCRR